MRTDPGKAIAKAAKLSGVTLVLAILLLFPAALSITKGWITASVGQYLAAGAMLLASFLTAVIFEQRGIIPALLGAAMLYLLLLLLAAGLRDCVFFPLRVLPFAGCALIGYAAAILTRNNKKRTIRNRRRRTYYK